MWLRPPSYDQSTGVFRIPPHSIVRCRKIEADMTSGWQFFGFSILQPLRSHSPRAASSMFHSKWQVNAAQSLSAGALRCIVSGNRNECEDHRYQFCDGSPRLSGRTNKRRGNAMASVAGLPGPVRYARQIELPFPFIMIISVSFSVHEMRVSYGQSSALRSKAAKPQISSPLGRGNWRGASVGQ